VHVDHWVEGRELPGRTEREGFRKKGKKENELGSSPILYIKKREENGSFGESVLRNHVEVVGTGGDLEGLH